MRKKTIKKLKKAASAIAQALGTPYNTDIHFKRLKQVHKTSPHNNKPVK